MIEMLFQDNSDYLFHQFHLHLVQHIQVGAACPFYYVLGPFLFLVYINDIVNDINNYIWLFADDTSLFVVVENDHAAAATSADD
jgi:hypothetical protein